MDLQKTGALIAAKRKEKAMTQKQLGEILNISDRTVSKWERGVGFPDVSLVEPLGEALGLSVLDIFRGEVQNSNPQEESAAREILNICSPQIRAQERRSRKYLLICAMMLLLLLAIPLLLTAFQGYWISYRPISAAKAAKISPDILITTEDYAYMDWILEDPMIHDAYTQYDVKLYLEGEDAMPLRSTRTVDGAQPVFLDISVSHDYLTVKYGSEYTCVILALHKGQLSKGLVLSQHPYVTPDGENIPLENRRGDRIHLDNFDNKTFQVGRYRAGWLSGK